MGNEKKVDVDVHIINDSSKNPPYDFWLGTTDNKVGKPKGDTLTFDNDGKYDGFDIRFHVVDETRKGFLFMDARKDANGDPDPNLAPMWVKKVNDPKDPCPDHEFWDEFKTTEVAPNNKTLHVYNRNTDKQLFKFAFMFSRTPHQEPFEIMYDPGGDNQNGPRPFTSKSLLAALALGGVAVGVILTLGVQALSNQ